MCQCIKIILRVKKCFKKIDVYIVTAVTFLSANPTSLSWSAITLDICPPEFIIAFLQRAVGYCSCETITLLMEGVVKAVMVGASGTATKELSTAGPVPGQMEGSWHVEVGWCRSTAVWGVGESVGWGEIFSEMMKGIKKKGEKNRENLKKAHYWKQIWVWGWRQEEKKVNPMGVEASLTVRLSLL